MTQLYPEDIPKALCILPQSYLLIHACYYYSTQDNKEIQPHQFTCPSSDEWMMKMWRYVHSGILFSHRRICNYEICKKMHGSEKYKYCIWKTQFFPYGDFSLKCLYLSYITRKQRYQVEWVEKRGMDLGRVCSDQSKHIVRNSQNITSLSLDCSSQIMTKRLLINYKILALA